MKANYLLDGTIAVSGTAGTVIFDRIWAGIGWPHKEPGYLCVVGQRTDGRYHSLWEKRGGLWELGQAAVEAKDRLLIDRVMVDASDEIAVSYMRTVKGLCFYEKNQGSNLDQGRAWTQFRGKVMDERPVAAISPVQERFVHNYRSALEKTRSLIMNGELVIHEANCPVMTYTLRQPLKDLLESPVMKALVWVITALDCSAAVNDDQTDNPEPWYMNVPRERF